MASQGQAEPHRSQIATEKPRIHSLDELDLDLIALRGGGSLGWGRRLRANEQGRGDGGDQPQYDSGCGPFALRAHGQALRGPFCNGIEEQATEVVQATCGIFSQF